MIMVFSTFNSTFPADEFVAGLTVDLQFFVMFRAIMCVLAYL